MPRRGNCLKCCLPRISGVDYQFELKVLRVGAEWNCAWEKLFATLPVRMAQRPLPSSAALGEPQDD